MNYEMRYCGGRWVCCTGECHYCTNIKTTTAVSVNATVTAGIMQPISVKIDEDGGIVENNYHIIRRERREE